MYYKVTKNFTKSNYKKPAKGSITDNIQNIASMKERLKNYEQVENIDNVPLGTHIRYLTLVDENGIKKQKFRLGGILVKKEKDYIKLKTRDYHWSVQKKHYDKNKNVIFETIFFKKISQASIDKNVILNLQKEIQQLKKENKILRQKLGISKNIKL